MPYGATDLAGKLPGSDGSPDEGEDHRGGQERTGGQRSERRGPGQNPASQSQFSRRKLSSMNTSLINERDHLERLNPCS